MSPEALVHFDMSPLSEVVQESGKKREGMNQTGHLEGPNGLVPADLEHFHLEATSFLGFLLSYFS